jgi:serine/threonine protein kinase
MSLNHPFSYHNYECQKINEQKQPQICNPYYSDKLFKIIRQMLSYDPSTPISLQELEENPFQSHYIRINQQSFPYQLNKALIKRFIFKEEY